MQLRRLGVTVVNAHFPTRNLYGLAIAKRLGLWRGQLVLSFHGSDVLDVKSAHHLWQTIAGATDAVTAVSKSLARQVADTELWPTDKIHIVPNGIDLEKFTPDKPSPIQESILYYILAVGNFVPLKGHDILLDAFSRIAIRHPDVHLVLAGGAQQGDWLAYLKKRAIELGLDERTHFLTDVPHGQIPALIRGAVLFAHSSHREGLPLVLLEAGAMGRAIVATSVGGIPEIIEDGVTGILVKPHNQDELTYSIERLLADDQLREQLGKALQQKVQQQFTIENMCSKYIAVLSETSS
jgi:glycosyltransferase involved in cell wall biosynthesis